MTGIPDVARNCQVFAGLDDVELQDVMSLSSVVEIANGAVICEEGKPADGLYIIETGTVCITKGDGPIPRELARLGPGDLFGEMALLLDAPRSADAVAATDCRLHRFDRESFLTLLETQDQPAYRLLLGFSKMLCERLREATEV